MIRVHRHEEPPVDLDGDRWVTPVSVTRAGVTTSIDQLAVMKGDVPVATFADMHWSYVEQVAG